MQSLLESSCYNLEKLSLFNVKSENIFTVEQLVQSLEKFACIREIEFNECCQSFSDKFFAHFASNNKQIKYVNSVRKISLRKVIINQINMAAEVFFDQFS